MIQPRYSRSSLGSLVLRNQHVSPCFASGIRGIPAREHLITSSVCDFHCVEQWVHKLRKGGIQQYEQTVNTTTHTFNKLLNKPRTATEPMRMELLKEVIARTLNLCLSQCAVIVRNAEDRTNRTNWKMTKNATQTLKKL